MNEASLELAGEGALAGGVSCWFPAGLRRSLQAGVWGRVECGRVGAAFVRLGAEMPCSPVPSAPCSFVGFGLGSLESLPSAVNWLNAGK